MTGNSFASPFGHAIAHPLQAEFGAMPASDFLPTSAPVRLTGLAVSSGTVASTVTGNIASMKSGMLSHFDTQLAALYQQQHGVLSANSLLAAASSGLPGAVSSDKKFVTIDVTAKDVNHDGQIDAADGAALLHQLQSIGLTHGSSWGVLASGTIAVDKLGALGHLLNGHDLGFAHESGMQTSAGLVDSQADVAEHGGIARHDFLVNGSGVGVGVLSDSFDTNSHASTHMADDIASGDLPADTTILQDIAHGSDEGRGMAQLVHDIAPGASIEFATAFTGQAGFANNIVALANDGNQVIVDDVSYFFELAYQEGPIAQAVDQVTAAGVSYFSSAGNNGHEGLEEAWHSGRDYLGGQGNGGYTLMKFASGQTYLPVTLAAGEIFILQWDEPGATAGGVGSASDLDLFLTDKHGATIYAASLGANIGGDPVEGFQINGGEGGTYYLRVGLYAGPAPTEIKLMALGNGAPVDLDPNHTATGNFNDGTMYGHAAADGAIAVGAVRYDATPAWGVNPPDSEFFTSAGPTRISFDNAGNRLAAPEDRGVYISAADGANTTFFGFNYDRDGYPNFFGTSAAAPDAAAVAALMIEAHAGLTPADIANLLQDSCLDMDNAATHGFDNGPDAETGAGFIQADLAVGFAATLTIQNDDAVALNGTHFSDVIVGNGNINVIDGGAGDDEITGGIRGDTLTGGHGADTFVYDSAFDSIKVRFDTITDLHNSDTIDLTGIDADQTLAGDQAFHIVGVIDGNPGELKLKFHSFGPHAGQTTIKGYTNPGGHADLLIVVDGHHTDFTNFGL
jgi:Subtilase family